MIVPLVVQGVALLEEVPVGVGSVLMGTRPVPVRVLDQAGVVAVAVAVVVSGGGG